MLHQHQRCRLSTSRPGATVLEFALVAPVFFFFIFGAIEVGRGLMTSHLLTNAARQGCREGILSGKSTSDIKTIVDEALAKQGYSGGTVTVKINNKTADASTAQSTDEITVAVSIPAASVTWLPVPQFLTGNLTGQYTLYRE